VSPLPAGTRGFVTFGCFNQFSKVSRPALRLWAQVLQALPTSRLVLLAQPGSHRDAVRQEFQAAGIADERIEFAARASRRGYFQHLADLDLALDPFPYNGHTTTMDALWMGVPVIALAGRTAVGRGGLSLLTNVGLPELIARTPEDYVAIAVAWAGDLTRLAALRAGLRDRMAASPLMDGKQYAADVEAAFRRMWETWCGPC
jgi:predicted O-linked N-acetylglucosamine transferase (SPINDLY family)